MSELETSTDDNQEIPPQGCFLFMMGLFTILGILPWVLAFFHLEEGTLISAMGGSWLVGIFVIPVLTAMYRPRARISSAILTWLFGAALAGGSAFIIFLFIGMGGAKG